MEEKKLGMTWLKIYTVLFVINILGTGWSFLGALATCSNNNLFGNSLALTILVLGAIELIFDIVAFVFFSKRTELGYYLNMVYIVATVLFAVSAQIVTEAYPIGSIMIACAFLLLVWSLPNFIYFKKRRFLFDGNTEKQSHSEIVKKKATIAATSTYPEEVIQSSNKENNEKGQVTIPADSLRDLKELYEAGVLTEEEFAEKKKQLLNI